MPPETDAALPPTAPGPLRAALAEAYQARRLIADALFEATHRFRDGLADHPHDPRGLAIAYGHMHALEMQWAEQDNRVWLLRERIRPRWRQDEDDRHEAA